MKEPHRKAGAPPVDDDRIVALTDLVDRVVETVGELNDRVESLTTGSAKCFAAMLSGVQAVRDALSGIGQGVCTGALRIVDRDGRVIATLGPDAGGRGGELRIIDPATGSEVALRP